MQKQTDKILQCCSTKDKIQREIIATDKNSVYDTRSI